MYTKFILDCKTADDAKDSIFKTTLSCSGQMKVNANTLMHFDLTCYVQCSQT